MEQNGKRKKGIIVLAVTAALLVCAAAAVLLLTVRIGGRLYRRADVIDARRAALSCADYDAAAAKVPGAAIRWSVPIGQERFDSFSETLTLGALPEEDVDKLLYFPRLKAIDAEGCGDYAALAAAARLLPETAIRWRVESAAGTIDGNAEELSAPGLSYAELRELIGLLPRLKELDLCGGALTTEEIDALRQEFGALDILYTLRFWGLELPSDSRSLQLDAGAAGGTEELKDALGRLEKLERSCCPSARRTRAAPCPCAGCASIPTARRSISAASPSRTRRRSSARRRCCRSWKRSSCASAASRTRKWPR